MDLTKKYLTEAKEYSLNFYECEHHGDADNYKDDIRDSGGKITDTKLEYDEETCRIYFKVSNYKAFMKKFEKTDSHDFLN